MESGSMCGMIPGLLHCQDLKWRRPNSHHLVTLVKDLFIPNSVQWNIPLLHQVFETHEVQAIMRIQPTSSSTFSAATSFNWMKLWEVGGISPRIILFLWRALHGGIAVGAIMNKILKTNGVCKCCSIDVETINHALLHCTMVRPVWEVSQLILPATFDQMSLSDFFSCLLSGTDYDQFCLAAATAWAIWKARNDLLFRNKSFHTDEIFKYALNSYSEYKNPPMLQASMCDTDVYQTLSEIQLHWIPPPENFTKINADGACKDGQSAAAAFARNHIGGFVGCASKAMGFGSPIEVEAAALLLSIQLLRDLDLANVIIESDAKIVIDAINATTSCCNWQIRTAVETCRALLQQRNDITFSYSPRCTNRVAHALANFSITYNVTNVWSGGLPPPPCMDPIFDDLAYIVPDSDQ